MNIQNKASTEVAMAISSLSEDLKLHCSCSACDSTACFTKRRQYQQCICDSSATFKSCLSFNNSNKHRLRSTKDTDIDECPIKEYIKKEITYDYDTDKDIEIRKKGQAPTKIPYETATKDNLEDIINSLSYGNENVTVTRSRRKVSPSRAKLSAQVMNVPYKDLEELIIHQKPETLDNLSKISPYDIFQKLKEVYKACSCKVCEFCKCIPCQCEDCNNFKTNNKDMPNSGIPADPDGCPCIRCERASCKGIASPSSHQMCDCVPCDCIQCTTSFSKPCNCDPCQCIECKAMAVHKPRTFVVAAVEEDHRRPCQCLPCECMECTHNYGIPSNLVRHEMSTGLNRHPHCHCDTCLNEACLPDANDTCKCERRDRVMRKPVQKDINDYDIHRAVIPNKINNYWNDTIAMYAAISNNYLDYTMSDSNNCACNQCECVRCIKHETTNCNIHLENIYNSFNGPNICNMNSSKCSDECKFCTNTKLPSSECSQCTCNECNCIDTKHVLDDYGIKKRATCKFSSMGDCNCNPCDCSNCNMSLYEQRLKERNEYEVIYPIKEEERLQPNITDKNINNSNINYNVDGVDNHFESIPAWKYKLKEKLQKNVSFLDAAYTDFQTNENQSVDLNRKMKTLFINSPNITANVLSVCSKTENIFVEPSESGHSLPWSQRQRFDESSSLHSKHLGTYDKETKCNTHNSRFTSMPVNYKHQLNEHERVQKTLERARNFSKQLSMLVEKYERANKEFNSSQTMNYSESHFKLKTEHYESKSLANTEVLNRRVYNATKNYSVDNIPTKDEEYPIQDTKDITSTMSNSSASINKVGNNFYTVSEENLDPSLVKDSIRQNDFNLHNNISVGKLQPYIKIRVKSKKVNTYYNKLYKRAARRIKLSKPTFVKKSITIETSKMCPSQFIQNNIEPNTKNYYNNTQRNHDDVRTLTENAYISNQLNINTSEFQSEGSNYDKLRDMKINGTESESKDTENIEDSTKWSVLNKNVCLASQRETRMNLASLQPLELEIKNAVQAIAWPTDNVSTDLCCHKNKALMNIQAEIKKLLELPILQTAVNKMHDSPKTERKSKTARFEEAFPSRNQGIDTNRLNYDDWTKRDGNSCEAMKVSFRTVRRVSDHTVMIKWNLPRALNNVNGYELLVDGCAVPKVLSASTSMAVVTCLPNADNILLTVRSITNSPCPSGHNPAATIVYKPKKKCQIASFDPFRPKCI